MRLYKGWGCIYYYLREMREVFCFSFIITPMVRFLFAMNITGESCQKINEGILKGGQMG